MTLLDELSGFEFEETMKVVFERMGYEDVTIADLVADEGRDIIMTERRSDGTETTVIVECKRTATVGRPVIQKLDSAVRTYDSDGPKRGMIATSGRVTGPGAEYAEDVGIEIFDGNRLREIADRIGMDLYNGEIEIVCEDVLNAIPPEGIEGVIESEVVDIEGFPTSNLPNPTTTLTLVPTVVARTAIDSTFETSVGVIHRIDDRAVHVLDCSRSGPSFMGESIHRLVASNLDTAIELHEPTLERAFDTLRRRRFGRTETEYRRWLTEAEIARHTTTVSYTGDNNVTYTRTCEPSSNDVTVESFEAVYTPRIHATVTLEGREYTLDWFNAGTETAITTDTFHECRVCSDYGTWFGLGDLAGLQGLVSKRLYGPVYTYCENCCRIVCQVHRRNERLSDTPVCTACSVTARFMGARRYFFDEENRAKFEEEYADRDRIDRIKENAIAVAGVIVFLLLILIGLV